MTTVTHTFTPRGACRDAFEHRGGEVLISGPAGTGKTRACLEKLHTVALLNAGMRGLMVRKTAASLAASGLVTWRRDVIAEQDAAVWFYGGSAAEPAQYRYANGSVVVIGGMDKASKVMSTEYDLIYVQEATELSEDDWEALTTRLRSGVVSFQQLLADCNPAQDSHWLKARCDAGRTVMLRSRHEDNPVLYDDEGAVTLFGGEYMATLDRLTGIRYQRLRKGEWSSAEGVVFEEWDSAVHLVDRFAVPDDWTRWWSVDFGFTNPFVCQHWAEDPDGRLYLYREFYMTGRTVDDHARSILDVVAPNGAWSEPRPRGIVCDHDAEGREVLRRELGLSTTGADKRVSAGLEAVMRRLKDPGDGKRRLYLMRDSTVERDQTLAAANRPTSTADEFPSYVWDQKQGAAPKEAPVKADDHGLDALRYLVMHLEDAVESMVPQPMTLPR